MDNKHRWLGRLAAVCALGLTHAVGAQGLATQELPRSVQDWQAWAWEGQGQRRCPPPHNQQGESSCLWPAQLKLQVDAQGARFQYEVHVMGAPARVVLPGDAAHWPQDAKEQGKSLALAVVNDAPTALLAPGPHLIEGRIPWAKMPQDLPLPPGLASLQFSLDGQVQDRWIGEDGRLWLRGSPQQEASGESLQIKTVRLLDDGVPMGLRTRFQLVVAGKARELSLPHAVLPGWTPSALNSPLPARLQPDGSLRVQARPGAWFVEIDSRRMQALTALKLPEGTASEEETWLVQGHPELRVISVQGASAVDPKQLEMPEEWRQLPAYRLRPGEGLQLQVSRRGMAEAAADEIRVQRKLWLDFDGQGYTLQDQLQGQFKRSTRLELSPPGLLGRVSVAGQDQAITRLADGGPLGVEIRHSDSTQHGGFSADSRIEGPLRSLPVSGWSTSTQAVQTQLQLPPGWLLLHASGVDSVQGSWVSAWTLWDLFFLMLAIAAATRLVHWRLGLLLGLGLALGWHLAGSPSTALWLVLLALLALEQQLPATPRLRHWLRQARLATALVLGLLLLPYAVQQLRLSLHPALEDLGRPSEQHADAAAPVVAPAPPYVAPAEEMAAPPGLLEEKPVPAKAAYSMSSLQRMRQQDPGLRVQTGPGLPSWHWRSVRLAWEGPVQPQQQFQLWLLPPWLTALGLRLGSMVLLVLALLSLLRAADRGQGPADAASGPSPWRRMLRLRRPSSAPATLAAAVFLACALQPLPAQAAGEGNARPESGLAWPTEAQLEQLRQKTHPAPTCLPNCAEYARAWLGARGNSVQLRLELHAQAEVAVPLPGQGSHWRPTRISVDGHTARTRRDEGGALWMAAAPGVNLVVLEGEVGSSDSVDIALPLPLRALQSELQGWLLSGLDARGLPQGALILNRELDRRGSAPAGSTQSDSLAPLVRIERQLDLDLSWQVRTHISRLTPDRTPVRVQFALLPQESLDDAAVKVADGIAEVQLGAEEALVLQSRLPVQAGLQLKALERSQQVETWSLAASPQWHVQFEGLAPTAHHRQGQWQPQWQPWPGEQLTLRIQRPAGAAGQTLTLDGLATDISPGRQATDYAVTLRLRSSLGGDQTLQLPAGAELLSLRMDGRELPLLQQAGRVQLPLTPGAHAVNLRWREASGLGTAFRSSVLGLPANGVNERVTLLVPDDRIALWVRGPLLGPAVQFWGVLIVLGVLAWLLRRVPDLPLSTTGTVLLGLGLAPTGLWGLPFVVAWLLVLRQRPAWRARLGPRTHNALQVLLVLGSLLALSVLLNALRVGLLGYPDLMVIGQDSNAHQLQWYADRYGSQSSSVQLLSMPLWVYRLLMLAWALWLALTLLGVLRWAWAHFSQGGLWQAAARPASASGSKPNEPNEPNEDEQTPTAP